MHQNWPTSNTIIMDDRSEKAKKGAKRHQLTGGPSISNLSRKTQTRLKIYTNVPKLFAGPNWDLGI